MEIIAMGIKCIINAIKKDDVVTLKEEFYLFKKCFFKDYDLNQVVFWKNEQRLLHVAAKFGSRKVLLYLLKQGVNINTADGQGNTAAHYAILYRQPKILKLLKENGANFLQRNKYGKMLDHYIQIRPVKEENKKTKKKLENIILETKPFKMVSDNIQFYFMKETTENKHRQLKQKKVDAVALTLLTEVTREKDENLCSSLSKIETKFPFFYNLSQESNLVQIEPLNLIKHNRPLNLSITSCFKKKSK